MKITKFIHKNVSKDGKVESGGAVYTDGRIIIVNGSCNLPNCHCSDGFSLSIAMPLKNGTVEGIKVKFKDKKEMKKILG